MHILDILIDLKAQTGKGSAGRKMDIMLANKDNLLLKDFFFWALDPSINYWQSKITTDTNQPFNDKESIQVVMLAILNQLVTRKLTGNTAKVVLTALYYSLGEKDAELLDRVITRKPDVGFSVSTVNKVWPNLIYDPPYMRCKGYSPKIVKDWGWRYGIYSQIKADGMFNNIILSDDLKMETRSGEKLPKLVDKLYDDVRVALDCIGVQLDVKDPVLHGELVMWKDNKPMERSKSNGIINKVKLGGEFPKGTTLKIAIWDYIPLHNFLTHEPYSDELYDERFTNLEEILDTIDHPDVQLIEYKLVYSSLEAQQHFIKCLQEGLEGTVVKNPEGIWKSHNSPNQLKLKNKFRFEMRVTGFTEGEGKFASTFGSMIIESECGKLVSAISGMTDKIRKMIHENRGTYYDAIVEIEANGLFKNDDGSYGIMHPRYKHLRDDRTEADTLTRIIQQEIDSIMGKSMEGK